MLRAAIVLGLLVLTSCQAEPSFDERYADTAKELGQKADELDEELAEGPGDCAPVTEEASACAREGEPSGR